MRSPAGDPARVATEADVDAMLVVLRAGDLRRGWTILDETPEARG